MNVSVIIVNYNSEKVLKNCLISLLKYSFYLSGVMVVDNNSSDDGVAMVRNNFSEVKLLINRENQGFSRANNLAAGNSHGELLFFLNPDTLIQEDIFKPVIEAFKGNNRLAIVAPGLVLPDGSSQPWACGHKGEIFHLIKNKIFSQFPSTQAPSPRLPDYPIPDYPITQSLTWVSGAALFVRRNVFRDVGGFDEKFFMYFEDRDFCQRVKKMGYEIEVMPEIKVVHLGGKSLTDNKNRKKLYYQSQSYYWQKKYGLFISLFLRLARWPYKLYICFSTTSSDF